MATHDNPTTTHLSGPMGDDYTVVVSTVNGALSVEIVLHNSEATLHEITLYTVDPDGWVVNDLIMERVDFIERLPEALQ